MFINLLRERNVECNSTGSAKPRYTESDIMHFHGFEVLYKTCRSLKKPCKEEKLVFLLEIVTFLLKIQVGGGSSKMNIYI